LRTGLTDSAVTMGHGVRVLVVGDDVLARAGLVALLAARDDLELVGQANPRELGRLAEHADVLLWDGGTSVGSVGLPDTQRPVVALIADDGQALSLLAAGVRGLLPRDAPISRIAATLATVSEGLLVLDEALAETVLRRAPAEPLVEPLTPREVEVLGLLAEGLPNKAIAKRLAISESTAKFHVTSVLGKLGAETRSEAIVLAARLGLVAL